MSRRLALPLAALLTLCLSACAPHEHVHVYGRVYDVSSGKKVRLADAEVWAVSEAGVPTRRAAVTDRAGDYEVELAPSEQSGGLGVIRTGYQREWWPLGTLSAKERRGHTKRLTLRVVREGVTRKRAKYAGRPLQAPPAPPQPAGE